MNIVPMALVARFSRTGPRKHLLAMRTSRALAVVIAVLGSSLLTSPAVAAASVKTKTVAFSGHYSGIASLLINNGSVTISSIRGKGKGTIVGASSVPGRGSASAAAQCDPFGGGGSITGAGAKITLTVAKSTASGCSNGESGPITVTFKGVAKATGGSGKTKGAAGSIKFSGSLKLANTSGSQNGPFTVALTGKLTVDG